MGQSYKGAEASFIDDAMFKLPYELMAQVIEKKDKAVQTEIDSAMILKDKLKAQALKVDQPALKQKILDYTQRIDDITAGIKGNVMDYSKFSDQTNQLSRDITQDWTMGDIYNMESNRTAYLENIKAIDEAAKKDPEKFRAGQADALKAAALAKYQGYKNSETGEYNSYKDATLYGTDPLTEHVDKAMKGAVGEFEEIETDRESGMWRVKTHNKWQGWKPMTELKPIWNSYLQNNPNIDLALGQVEELGLGNRKQEETQAFDYLFNKYGKRQVMSSTSQTMSEEGKLKKAKELEEPDTIEVKDKTYVTTNTSTAASTYKTISEANTSLKAIGAEISAKVNPNNKYYNEIIKGDPTAIRAYFSADPATAEKYISQFEEAYSKKNAGMGAIRSYNNERKKKGLSEIPTNPSKWSTKDQENFTIYQSKKGVGMVTEVQGVWAFPSGTTQATQKQYQETVGTDILGGTGKFKLKEPIPSIKLGGAKVMTYDPDNIASKAIVKGNMKVTYGGKDYWFNSSTGKVPTNFTIGKKVIPIDKIGVRNVVVYEPVKGGETNMTYFADQGHISVGQDNESGNFIYAANPEKPGERVKIDLNKSNFIPSTVRNQQGKFTGKGSFAMGPGSSFAIEYDSDTYSTRKMREQQEANERDSKLELNKLKGGIDKSYYDEFQFRNTKGIIEDGKYYLLDSDGQLKEISDSKVKSDMYQTSITKRN